MLKRDELTNPNSCMSRARDDERTFVLLARDAAAPFAIRAWVEERIRLGKNTVTDSQILEALDCAARMEAERDSSALAGIARPAQEKEPTHLCIGCERGCDCGAEDPEDCRDTCTRCAGTNAEAIVKSLATMLGWENVPPQHVLEAEIRALKARAEAARPTRDGGTAASAPPRSPDSRISVVLAQLEDMRDIFLSEAPSWVPVVNEARELLQALAASAPPLSPDSRSKLIAARNDLMSAITSLRGGHSAVMDTCDEAIAALDIAIGQAFASPASPPRAWQPMDSAPTDGTWILAYGIDGTVQRVSWGQSRNDGLQWCTAHGYCAFRYLTHWMPLPDPPGVTRAAP